MTRHKIVIAGAGIGGLTTGASLLQAGHDVTIFDAKRETWNPPRYQFAPNYLRQLTPAAAVEATAELEGLQARWPEFQAEIQHHCREVEARAEAIRIREESERKQAAADKKKQAAAAKS